MNCLLDRQTPRFLLVGVSSLIMASTLSRTSSSEPQLYDLSGEVTFDGEPLPSGRVQFEPDHQKSDSGPAGYAEIENGKYDTQKSGRGTGGGPHIAAFRGYSGETETIFDEDAGEKVQRRKMLFQRYEEHVDIPTSDSTMDFEIPASPVKKAR